MVCPPSHKGAYKNRWARFGPWAIVDRTLIYLSWNLFWAWLSCSGLHLLVDELGRHLWWFWLVSFTRWGLVCCWHTGIDPAGMTVAGWLCYTTSQQVSLSMLSWEWQRHINASGKMPALSEASAWIMCANIPRAKTNHYAETGEVGRTLPTCVTKVIKIINTATATWWGSLKGSWGPQLCPGSFLTLSQKSTSGRTSERRRLIYQAEFESKRK